ncbi:uncharacterized protein LOC143445512 isoform X1 [Clavelina lepadiformis]|uniref:uncharacterized protein LOC143445512 isoform X1 n=1 Tax=Clavelina lepadiformis TaxID=159417 RepID=UPI0040423C4A
MNKFSVCLFLLVLATSNKVFTLEIPSPDLLPGINFTSTGFQPEPIANIVCYEGFNMFSKDPTSALGTNVAFTNNIAARYCQNGEICASIDLVRGHGNNSLIDGMVPQLPYMLDFYEYRFCVGAHEAGNYSCEVFPPWFPLRPVQDVNPETCLYRLCYNNTCNGFTNLCGDPLSDALQLLPRCSLSIILNDGFDCLAPWIGEFPFEDEILCRSRLDSSVACMFQFLSKCFEGNCPTLFGPAAFFYQILPPQVFTISSLDDFLGLLLVPTDSRGLIYDLVCPVPGAPMPETILHLLEMAENISVVIENPICDKYILNDLIEWGLDALMSVYEADNHTEVCQLVTNIKTRVLDAWEKRCNKTAAIGLLGTLMGSINDGSDNVILTSLTQDLNPTALSSALDTIEYFLENLELPNCNGGQQLCYQGINVFSTDLNTTIYTNDILESNIAARYCQNGQICASYNLMHMYSATYPFNSTFGQGPSMKIDYYEYRFCVNATEAKSYSCGVFPSSIPFGNLVQNLPENGFANCTYEFCYTDECNNFTNLCPDSSVGALQLLPRCSLSTILNDGFDCLAPWIGEFPFEDEILCRSRLDSSVACMFQLLSKCLEGNCPTLFGPAAFFYQILPPQVFTIISLDDFLGLLLVPTDSRDLIYDLVCPVPGAPVPETILHLLEMAENISVVIENPICDKYILNDLIDWGLDALNGIYEANNHTEFCQVFTTIKTRALGAWKNRCNRAVVTDLLVSLLDSIDSNDPILSSLKEMFNPATLSHAIDVVEKFVVNLQIPNCFADIDECQVYEDVCGELTCFDTIGSYQCLYGHVLAISLTNLTYTSDLSNLQSNAATSLLKVVLPLLQEIYGEFVEILGFEEGSIVVIYKVFYGDQSSTQDVLNMYLGWAEQNTNQSIVFTGPPKLRVERLCFQGINIFSTDRNSPRSASDVLESNMAARHCQSGQLCASYNLVFEHSTNSSLNHTLAQGQSLQIGHYEYRFCVDAQRAENYSCDMHQSSLGHVVQKLPASKVTNCTYEFCDNDKCNGFTNFCPDLSTGALQLLPRCSLSTILNDGFDCLAPWIGEFLFEDEILCRSRLDSSVACMFQLLSKCFEGNCPTLFGPAAFFYQILPPQVFTISSLDDFLGLLLVPTDSRGLIYDLVCPVPGAPVPETIHHLLEMAENISVVIENPICDKYILNDLIEWGLDALNGIYEANNHTEFCQVFTTIKTRALGAWKNRCNRAVVTDLLVSLLDSIDSNDPILSSLKETLNPATLSHAIDVVEKFVVNLQIPNCFADIDECQVYEDLCGELKCFNTIGSYQCLYGHVLEISLTNLTYTSDLSNLQSNAATSLLKVVLPLLQEIYGESVEILGFEEGSIIVIYEVFNGDRTAEFVLKMYTAWAEQRPMQSMIFSGPPELRATSNTSQLICNLGMRRFTSDRNAILSESISQQMCPPGYFCGLIKYLQVVSLDSFFVFAEYGLCIAPDEVANFTCDKTHQLMRTPALLSHIEDDAINLGSNCTFYSCEDDNCNQFSNLSTCHKAFENDVLILPNCTVTKVLDDGFDCLVPYLSGYPFEQQFLCRNVIDSSISCLSELLSGCLEGQCLSTLALLIEDVLQGNISQLNSLEAILLRFDVSLEVSEIVYNLTCPGPAMSAPEVVIGLLPNILNETIEIENPVCDDYFVHDILHWGIDALMSILRTESHAEFCQTVMTFKDRAINAWHNRCRESAVIDAVEFLLNEAEEATSDEQVLLLYLKNVLDREVMSTILDIVVDFFEELEIPFCSKDMERLVCNLGSKIFTANKADIIINSTRAKTCYPGQICGLIKIFSPDMSLHDNSISIDILQQSLYTEFGLCIDSNPVENITCQHLASNASLSYLQSIESTFYDSSSEHFGELNCTLETCNKQSCNNFSDPLLMCDEMYQNDILVLPNCPLQYGLSEAFGCLDSFFGGYPFGQQSMCRSTVDSSIFCLLQRFAYCLNGSCSSVFGPRELIHLLLMEAEDGTDGRGILELNSLGSLLARFELQSNLSEAVYSTICRVANSSLPEPVAYLISSIENSTLALYNPICDEYFLRDVIQWAIDTLREVYRASNHQEFCVTMMSFKNRTLIAWQERCNDSASIDLITYWMNSAQDYYSSLILRHTLTSEILTEAFKTIENFFQQWEVPNCGETPVETCDRQCGENARCVRSEAVEECVCEELHKGDPEISCRSFCHNQTLSHNGETYIFNEVWSGQIAYSQEKCENNGRSPASALCLNSQLTDLIVVECNTTVAAVLSFFPAEMVELITEEVVESFSRNLELVTSEGSLTESETKSVINAVTAIAESEVKEISSGAWLSLISAADVVTESLEGVQSSDAEEEKDNLLPVLEELTSKVILPKNVSSLNIETNSFIASILRVDLQSAGATSRSTSQASFPNITIDITIPGLNTSSTIAATVTIPLEALQQALLSPEFNQQLITFYYKSLTLFTSQLNATSPLAVSFGSSVVVQNLVQPIIIQYTGQSYAVGERQTDNPLEVERTIIECRFWDFSANDWSSDGCCLDHTQFPPVCQCNHLTNFALLVARDVVPNDVALAIFSDVGCILSIIALIVTVILHLVQGERRKLQSTQIFVNICCNLIAVYVIFVAGIEYTGNSEACTLVTALLHYFLLTTWSWMATYSYEIYMGLVKVFRQGDDSYLVKAYVLAYGVPLLVVGITLGITVGYVDVNDASLIVTCSGDNLFATSSYRADNMCWLKGYPLYFGFLLPVGIALLMNLLFFFLVLRKVVWAKSEVTSTADKLNATQRMWISLTLFSTMGISWIFGYFMLISTDPTYSLVMSWIFTLTSATQGLLIFVMTCVRYREMRKRWTGSIVRAQRSLRDKFSQSGSYDVATTSGKEQSTDIELESTSRVAE